MYKGAKWKIIVIDKTIYGFKQIHESAEIPFAFFGIAIYI